MLNSKLRKVNNYNNLQLRAKEHCENFYFHLGATIDEVFFSYLASGGQSDVYKCGVDQSEPKIEPDKVKGVFFIK